jgi:hypothetical protein
MEDAFESDKDIDGDFSLGTIVQLKSVGGRPRKVRDTGGRPKKLKLHTSHINVGENNTFMSVGEVYQVSLISGQIYT